MSGTFYSKRGEGVTDLKPCPFCGRAVKIIQIPPSGYSAFYLHHDYAVAIVHEERGVCIGDSLASYRQDEESMMIDLWNRRVNE